MELKVNTSGKIKSIEIAGKFDIESTEEFESIFAKVIEPNPSVVSIELSRLDYIDSSGIGSSSKV